jgi:hypothetical protein
LLSLSASIDIWQNDGTADSVPDLSININVKHGLQNPIQPARKRAWTHDNFDTKPPDSVFCADLEKIQIRFDFLEIQKTTRRVKKAKSAAQPDIEEEMLLDIAPPFDAHGDMDELFHTIAEMRGLSSIIEQCFQPVQGFGEDPDLLQSLHLPSLPQHDSLSTPREVEDILDQQRNGNEVKNGRPRHPKAATEILNSWLQANRDNLHPSTGQIVEIMSRTGLSRGEQIEPMSLIRTADGDVVQVKNWFSYQRRKIRKDSAIPEDRVLLAHAKEDIFTRRVENKENKLFSQRTDKTRSLTPQPSVALSFLSVGKKELTLKRPSSEYDMMLPDKLTACNLGEAAMHILASGYVGRGLRGHGGIHVENPSPSLSLARLAPSNFCPGFKKVCVLSTFNPLTKWKMFRSPWPIMPTFFQPYPTPSLSLGHGIFNRRA